MAKPHLTLHVHAGERVGPLLLSARAGSGVAAIRDSKLGASARPAANSLGAVLKLANAIGAPVLVSLSNERLWRALTNPAERKALSDGVSRGRLMVVPTAGLDAELSLLAPFEIADELRLNVDLWRRALITPSFAEPPGRDTERIHLDPRDPAATVNGLARSGRQRSAVLMLDLAACEQNGAGSDAVGGLAVAIRARNDFQLSQAASLTATQVDQMLGDLLIRGGSYPSPLADGGYDPAADGFPIELARELAGARRAPRAVAPAGARLTDSGFDLTELDGDVSRDILLRMITRRRGDASPRAEQIQGSFLTAVALMERVAADDSLTAGTLDAAALTVAQQIPARLEQEIARATDAGVDADAIAAAKKAKTRAVRATPKPEAAPIEKSAALQDLIKAGVAAVQCAALLCANELPADATEPSAASAADA